MDTPASPLNQENSQASMAAAEDNILTAMRAARQILRALERCKLPQEHVFKLQQDDLNGWPRMRVLLFRSASRRPELPSLTAHIEEYKAALHFCLFYQGCPEIKRIDIRSPAFLDKLKNLCELSSQHFVELVQKFVDNAPLSGRYDRSKVDALPEKVLDETPQTNNVALDDSALGMDDDFFKSEQDFKTLREEMLVSNSFRRGDSSGTSLLTRRGTEEIDASPQVKTAVTFDPGSTVVDRYKVLRKIGRGGMGMVYLVADQLLEGEQMAMKVLASEFIDQAGYIKRFLREVQLMRRINHPNVARTYDVMVNNQLVFFTMEYVTGRSLAQILDKDGLPQAAWPSFLRQLCSGLEAIHQAGIIHRDLTPGNIMFYDQDHLKILDFGVARPDESNFTMHKEIIGSVNYIAPEIWQGKQATPALDLYSLGVILYEMTTGIIPFQGKNIPDSMRMHVSEMVPAPRERKPEVPEWISSLTMRLLEKQPNKRPKSAAAILKKIPALA